jgi:hypothetical protein
MTKQMCAFAVRTTMSKDIKATFIVTETKMVATAMRCRQYPL